MGIAWLLLRRTFAARPKRTLLFLLGYALATGVMITLLAVGHAVLLQARDKDLFGGGDIILVPHGIDIESIKTGGLSALYFSIPQGRFLTRQMLQSTRFKNDVVAAAPYLFSELLYARSDRASAAQAIFADGSIPQQEEKVKGISLPWENSNEDRKWLDASGEDFYNRLDHFHLPSVENADFERWAEWHYFNFSSPNFTGYLSFMVAGNVLNDTAKWDVAVQIGRQELTRYSMQAPATRSGLPLKKIDYAAGNNAVRFIKDHYEIKIDFHDRNQRVFGEIRFYPHPNMYFPAAELARTDTIESGYVIPAVQGTFQGYLNAGNQRYDLSDVTGYHDHNWGIWQQVEWNWGHAFSKEQNTNYALFFGEVFLEGNSKGLFAGVFDRNGFLALFRPEDIKFSEYTTDESGLQVPTRLAFSQKKRFTSINLDGTAESFVVTPVEGTPGLHFVQLRMNYNVLMNIDGKKISFPAFGNAETYIRD